MSARDEIITVLDAKGGWRSTALSDALADRILSTLCAMPEPDRLALARELAGPGYAVVPVEDALDQLERFDMWAGDNSDRPGSRTALLASRRLRSMLTAAQEPTP